MRRMRRGGLRAILSRRIVLCLAVVLALGGAPSAGVYVTETSGIRWNDVGGIRWNDVGGIRWNDVGGIRWNDVGGIRWNDVGGVLFTDASGIRWNDVGGIRWNDVGGLQLDDAIATGRTSVDLELLNVFSTLPDTSSLNVIITYRSAPTAADLANLNALGIPGGTIFRRLPMVVVNATRDQIRAIAALPAVRSVYANRTLSFFDEESRALIGLDEVAADPALILPGGTALSGAGITIAILDSGVDGTHPDLPYGTKVVENVRLSGAVGTAPGFLYPAAIEGVENTDLVLGHGTFVASVAAGSGAASGGTYRGIAPGASILSLSAGEPLILHTLEGFDYILANAARFQVRVVNCSWGTEGWFDPDDPVNVATHLLYDAGVTVVFAAGNHGPSADTLNPYAVAPWVIGVGSTRKDGRLSTFSSRGIFEELLYHPTLVAPGEAIIAARTAAFSQEPAYAPHYAVGSGTSFAAPHVAGVVALMLQARPSLTPLDIKRILQATATPILPRRQLEVGAGALDAWASLTQALDAARPFGTHVPGWLDLRPYRIDHRPAVITEAVVPAGGSVLLPVSLDGSPLSWQMSLAWGTLPGLSDLDVRVTDSAGAEVGRSEASNGASLFGRAEGVHLLGALPSRMTAEIFFKAGTGLADQPLWIRQESAVAVVTAYVDVAALPPADQATIGRVVSRHVLIGRGSLFDPSAGLSRGELARALALTAGIPQRIPANASFSDSRPGDADYPYVETVAGVRARQVLIDPTPGSAFQPKAEVTRLDFAVSLVRAAGQEAEALARAGESLGLTDEDRIPAALRGYVAVALEQGLIDTIPVSGGAKFDPKGSVPRLKAARFLLELLDLR
ncbi:MAG: S8 family serine peptidase [Acidobacteria bacterium]|nr:S8 family serine peptidase [Acidobacteriota bacterium]